MRITRQSSAQGFSLLEVLITLVLLAFGLLGLAALQMKTLQSSHSAYQRGVANIVAADTVERMWANVAAAAPLPTAQIRQLALQRWTQTANNQVTLPGIDITIIEPAAGDTLYTVQVSWDETRFDDNQTTFSYSFRLYP